MESIMSWVISALSGSRIPGNDRFHHFPWYRFWNSEAVCWLHLC